MDMRLVILISVSLPFTVFGLSFEERFQALSYEERFRALERYKSDSEGEMIKLKDTIGRLDEALAQCETQDPDTRVESSKTNLICRPTCQPRIAFTAYLDHDINLPGNKQTLVFNKVILNDGNGYNEHTGVFTCPRSGVYSIFAAVGNRGVNQAWIRVVVNGKQLFETVADGFHKYADVEGSNLAHVRLQRGNTVMVTFFDVDVPYHVKVAFKSRLTTFSGVFLYD